MTFHIEAFEDNHMGASPDIYSLVDDAGGPGMQIEVTSGGPHAHPLAEGTKLRESASRSELIVRPPIKDQDRLDTVALAFSSLLLAAPQES